jgi:hypothetical protein
MVHGLRYHGMLKRAAYVFLLLVSAVLAASAELVFGTLTMWVCGVFDVCSPLPTVPAFSSCSSIPVVSALSAIPAVSCSMSMPLLSIGGRSAAVAAA